MMKSIVFIAVHQVMGRVQRVPLETINMGLVQTNVFGVVVQVQGHVQKALMGSMKSKL